MIVNLPLCMNKSDTLLIIEESNIYKKKKKHTEKNLNPTQFLMVTVRCAELLNGNKGIEESVSIISKNY